MIGAITHATSSAFWALLEAGGLIPYGYPERGDPIEIQPPAGGLPRGLRIVERMILDDAGRAVSAQVLIDGDDDDDFEPAQARWLEEPEGLR